MDDQTKKGGFAYGLYDRKNKQLLRQEGGTKIAGFDYPSQAIEYLNKRYAGSTNFCVYDLKKRRCVGK